MNFEKLEKKENNKNKEKIVSIESIKTGPQQKAGLALVLLGEKPGVSLTVYTKTEEEIAAEEGKIAGLELNFKKVSQEEKGGQYRAKFIVSRSEDILNQLSEASPAQDHDKFGILMGYPASAVKAFLEGNCLDIEEQNALISQHPEIVFHDFRLSKDNSEEELNLLKRWNNLVKEEASDIYNELKVVPKEA